jgi:paraquat-inducible protein B
VDSPYPEIPTLHTQLEEVATRAAEFFAELQQIDVKGLVNEIKAATASARGLLDSPGVRGALEHLDETMAGLDETLASLRATSDTAREVIDPLRADLAPTLAELRATLTELRATASNTGAVMRPDSPLIVAFEKALADAAATAKTIKDFAALLERRPDAMLKGKGAPQEKR